MYLGYLHCVGKSDTSMLYYLHGIVGMGKGGTSVLCYLHGIGNMGKGYLKSCSIYPEGSVKCDTSVPGIQGSNEAFAWHSQRDISLMCYFLHPSSGLCHLKCIDEGDIPALWKNTINA